MNRQTGSLGWVSRWGFFLVVGGMILYAGYFGTGYITQDRRSMTPDETYQAVSASTADVPEIGEAALMMHIKAGDESEEAQTSVSNSSKINHEILGEQNLKNFPCPVYGSLLRSVGNYYSEAFDNYLFHAGLDYAAPEGTMIRATHGGKVIFSGADPILGQKVILDCGEGWLVTYGSLDNLRVQVGETVEIQDALGQVGLSSGAESERAQPQLHYEVWHRDEVQSPE